MDKEKTIWIGSGGSQTKENLTNLIKIHFLIINFQKFTFISVYCKYNTIAVLK